MTSTELCEVAGKRVDNNSIAELACGIGPALGPWATGQRRVVSPTERMICFWKAIIRSTRGNIARVVPAITRVQLLLYCDCRAEVATVITRHSGPEVMTDRKSVV